MAKGHKRVTECLFMAKAGLVLEISEHGGSGTGWCAPQRMTSVHPVLRPRAGAQRAENVPVAPASPERLPHQLRVAPAQPIAERARCVPDGDGGKPPSAKESSPA